MSHRPYNIVRPFNIERSIYDIVTRIGKDIFRPGHRNVFSTSRDAKQEQMFANFSKLGQLAVKKQAQFLQ